LGAEEVAERAQEAAGGGGGGEEGRGFGVVEEVAQGFAVAGGFPAEEADEPGVAAGEFGPGTFGLGVRGLGRAMAGRALGAGGDAGDQRNDVAGEAAEAGVEDQGEGAEDAPAGGDEGAQGGDDLIEAAGESQRLGGLDEGGRLGHAAVIT
jgi:hypothetical protein